MSVLPPLSCLAAAALALAGCAPDDGFPSLAPRPAERALSTEEPVRARLAAADDTALRAQVSELRVQATQGDREFDSAWPAAEAAIGAAGPRESERWIEAQQRLSRLEAARAATTRALAELDRLALARAEQPTSDADYELIREALAAAGRIAARQQERLDRLRSRLSGR